MKLFFHFIVLLFIAGCVSDQASLINISKENYLPKDQLFSTDYNDPNNTYSLYFQTLSLNDNLFRIIDLALKENPLWQSKLAKVEYVRAKSGYLTDESSLKLNSSVGLMSGKENSRESGFKTQSVPDYQTNARLGWEIDILGKWSEYKKESVETVNAAVYFKEGAQLSFVYDIAKLWYQYLYLTEDLSKIEEQIRNHHEFHILHIHSYHAGLDDNESLIIMENEIKYLALEHIEKKKELSICRTALQTMLGNSLSPEIPYQVLFSKEPIPESPRKLPSTALKGRPDIMEMQSKLIAQIHRAKASHLNLYPSLSLNLNAVGMTGDLSSPFNQWKLSGGPILDIPLWNPRRMTQLRTERAKLKLLELEWKSTILNAVKDIETSLISYNSTIENWGISNNIANEYTKLVTLNKQKYNVGILSKIDLLKSINVNITKIRKASAVKLSCFYTFLDLSKNLGINWANN